jgi:hypothetical protein
MGIKPDPPVGIDAVVFLEAAYKGLLIPPGVNCHSRAGRNDNLGWQGKETLFKQSLRQPLKA